MNGYISSYETLGTFDGPGLRFVVFMQGCNFRCGYCHNPETLSLDFSKEKEINVKDLFEKILRYKSYFENGGGVTFSGGEPLIQSEFLIKIITMLKKENIHVAIDTNGSINTKSSYKASLLADLIILDLKMPNEELYNEYIKGDFNEVIKYLNFLNENNKDVIIRNVIVNGINNKKEDVLTLKNLLKNYKNIKKIELLPFKKICKTKYENLNINFPFDSFPETSDEDIKKLNEYIYL